MYIIIVAALIIILVSLIGLKYTNSLVADKSKLQEEIVDLRLEYMKEREKVIKLEGSIIAQRNQQIQQETYLNEMQLKSKFEFELLANKILDDKSAKFTAQNRANLDLIINPLRENIKAFEEKVERVYKSESDERNVLKGVILQLMDQSKLISEEASNLTRALKGDSKKQGNWGEVILERILERSGLVKDREYRLQASLNHNTGNRLQPDVILDLPDEKHIVIDAKVSLVAYERLLTADSEEDRITYIKQHILSIKTHIQSLSNKNYHELYQINSPDFVLLFMPIESSFGLAVQQDADLFNYAWDKKVVIVSPSTLLATLRTIASIWKQERQNRNVLEIARLSGIMYDKFVGFLNDMDGIGKNVRQTQDAYEKALNKLSTGAGNLTTTAEKIKKLGAKATKQIDTKFLDINIDVE
jgi:DNA recombination protein RmuC